jgi:hypothetical protein
VSEDIEGKELPPEIREALCDALHKLAVFIHEEAGVSHVIVQVTHISNALARQATTSVIVGGGGTPIERKQENAVEMADNIIKSMMEKAKNKGKQ